VSEETPNETEENVSVSTFDRDGYLVANHPVFMRLHQDEGSGWYTFTERLGLGGIFRLTSRGVIPFNPPQDRRATKMHDEYDILRAIDDGRIRKVSS